MRMLWSGARVWLLTLVSALGFFYVQNALSVSDVKDEPFRSYKAKDTDGTASGGDNRQVAGCVIVTPTIDNCSLTSDFATRGVDSCEGGVLTEYFVSGLNGNTCQTVSSSTITPVQSNCNAYCIAKGFASGTCETKYVAACDYPPGDGDEVGYCKCTPSPSPKAVEGDEE